MSTPGGGIRDGAEVHAEQVAAARAGVDAAMAAAVTGHRADAAWLASGLPAGGPHGFTPAADPMAPPVPVQVIGVTPAVPISVGDPVSVPNDA